MPVSEANVPGAPRTPRRTVRIVETGSASRTAVISFLITAAAAVLALMIWLSLRTPIEEPAVQRGLAEISLDWRCQSGHYLRAWPGQIGPRTCERCREARKADTDMWPIATWSCENNHKHDVAVLLELNPEGKPVPVEFRLRNRDWVAAGIEQNCPRCGKPLGERVRDPLGEFIKRPAKRPNPQSRGE